MFHENTHIVQDFELKKDDVPDYKRYLMGKESVIENIYPGYYNYNYNNIYREIDANHQGAKKLVSYIKELGLDNQSLVDSIVESYSKKAEIESAHFFLEKKVRYADGVADFQDLADVIIKSKPECIQKFPFLKVEYDEKGNKKNLRTILSENENRNDNTIFLCMLIKEGNIMTKETFADDVDYLIEWANKSNNNHRFLVKTILNDTLGEIATSLANDVDSMDFIQVSGIKHAIGKINSQLRREQESTDIQYNSKIFSNEMGKTRMVKKGKGFRRMTGIECIQELQERIDSKLEQLSKLPELKDIRFLKSATQGIKENEIANMQKEFIKQGESHREDNERKFEREHRNPENRRNLDRNRAPRFQRGRSD